MESILTEISLLSEKDCFYIVERHKSEFSYPLHRHREFELNFVENAPGVKRIVGDSIETIGEYDLVLIGGENIEHTWQQGECNSKDIREITVQFSPDLFQSNIISKNQFLSIRQMLDKAKRGISFPQAAIMKVYGILDTIAEEKDGFMQLINFLTVLYHLSKYEPIVLGSSTVANSPVQAESKRIIAVKDYISANYKKEIKLEELAQIAGMSVSAFSRFFKIRTHRTVTDYITDFRIGQASRALIDTSMNISEICYASGFNNLSNFNRTFKAKKGMTPKNFRAVYKKNKIFV